MKLGVLSHLPHPAWESKETPQAPDPQGGLLGWGAQPRGAWLLLSTVF